MISSFPYFLAEIGKGLLFSLSITLLSFQLSVYINKSRIERTSSKPSEKPNKKPRKNLHEIKNKFFLGLKHL